jgi:hypothetical protein
MRILLKLVIATALSVGSLLPCNAAPPDRIFEVCHGESSDGCNIQNTHWVTFEQCSRTNGVGGADSAKSCMNLCGQKLGEGCEVSENHFPMKSGYCGYSWFEVRCYAGPPNKIVGVCHGQTLSDCRVHPFDQFEHCGNDNGVGGFNANVSCHQWCGQNYRQGCETAVAAPGKYAGFCGYSWVTMKCH